MNGVKRGTLSLCLTAALVAGCSDMSPSQQRALTGATGGAAGGALIGAIGGNAGMGAAIGAGAGLAGGMIYDYHKRSQEKAYQQGVQAGQSSQATGQTPPAK